MTPLIVLFTAVIAGAIGLQIGRFRGRASAGFAWGFLLGPIGWLIVLTGPDLRPRCPECGSAVVPGYQRCGHCGAERETENLADTAPIPLQPRQDPVSDRLFDIEFEGDRGHLRPIVAFHCLACGETTRTPLPRERQELHRLSCDCGFTCSVSSEELIAETLRVGADLGQQSLDTGP